MNERAIYEAAQAYRHWPPEDQKGVAAVFEYMWTVIWNEAIDSCIRMQASGINPILAALKRPL